MKTRKKDWTAVFSDTEETSDSLTLARERRTKYYKNKCKIHGDVPFYTKDMSCPQCHREKANIRKNSTKENRKSYTAIQILGKMKKRKDLKNIPFDLNLHDLKNLLGDTERCPIFGCEITYVPGRREDGPSIDRLIPERGYVKENVSVISYRANRLKSDGTPEEHMRIALWTMKKMGYSEEQILQEVSCLIQKL